jgi:hypothetical protein
MRVLLLLATTLPVATMVSPDVSMRGTTIAADVAVAPFTVDHDSAGVLRSVADTCLERLVRGLTAEGIEVARYPQLSEKDLRSARPVPLAVLGHVDRAEGQVQAELRLMDVESGEELRSYFNADKDPDAVGNLGSAAAKRIAQLVHERKGAR